MLGLLLGFGADTSCAAMILGAVLACCAICSLYKVCDCRVRDCSCIKRILRCCGCDPYPDLDLFVVVHEVLYTAHSKVQTCVRLTAGRHQVVTDLDSQGVFHQPLSLFVEQGTEDLLLEMLDANLRLLAHLRFRLCDIVECKEDIRQKVYAMQQKDKYMVNPRVRLTIRQDASCDEEEALLTNITEGASTETTLLLQDHLKQMKSQTSMEKKEEGGSATEMKPLSELDILAKGCSGALQKFGSWGRTDDVYLSVLCPPERKKHTLGLWKNESDCEFRKDPQDEIDLLKVLSVQPDAGRTDVFLLNYVNSGKIKSRHTFRRVDRSRDVWVEMLSMLISKVREDKDAKKREQMNNSKG